MTSGKEFYNQRTPQNTLKLGLSVLSVARWGNPILGLTLGIADATGFTDWTLNKVFKK